MQRKKSGRRQAAASGTARRNKHAALPAPVPPTLPDRLIFEHNLIGMYHTTQVGQIVECNESMARMLGYASRGELLTHKATDLYHTPDDRKAFLARLRRTGVLTNSELCLRRKDGASIYILETVRLVPDARGGPATIQGTMVDITERKLAEKALRESAGRHRALAEELRRLARHVQDVREEERTRIARELHDELGQALTVLNMDLHWLRACSRRESDVARPRIASMCKLVDQTIQTLRRICTDLRPTLLDDLGLVAAIEWQAREFQSRTGLRCMASLPRTALDLPRDQVTAVFRILQESLTNVARHACATRVKVSLCVRSRTLILKVGDNGVGITREQSSAPRSLGLLGMRERAVQWGGQVDVDAVPGKGTMVVLRMPIQRQRTEPAS